jgi:hypothetical protein
MLSMKERKAKRQARREKQRSLAEYRRAYAARLRALKEKMNNT